MKHRELLEIEKARIIQKSTRLDDSDEGQWITTENGHKVHINESGKPDKGNPHVVEVMKKGKKGGSEKKPKSSVPVDKMSRKQLVAKAHEIYIKNQGHFGLSEEEAERRFRLLIDGNTDAQLRKYIKKHG